MGGVDRLDGGEGDDTFRIENAADVLVEAEGEGHAIARTVVNYTLGGGVHVEELQAAGSAATDLTGNELRNVLRGNDGSNILKGEGGNDLLDGGAGEDDLRGGAGTDFAVYWDAAATDIQTGRGLFVSLNDTRQNTGEAKDDKYDSIEGLQGSRFADTLEGSMDANDLHGRDGNDRLYGLDGRDFLSGGAGDDRLYGGAGVDGDVFHGGADFDIVEYAGATSGIVVDLADITKNRGDAENDVYEDNSIEGIGGTAHRDRLYDDDGQRELYGNGGDDELWGRGSDDLLEGGQGNDLLVGGVGNDTLDGGSGTDTAVFSGRRADYDIITTLDDKGYMTVSRKDGTDTDKFKDIRILRFESAAGTEEIALTNAAPTGLQLSKSSIQENAPGGAEVGTLSARDADGDALTYTLLPGSSSAFAIRGNKLVVTGPFDFESKVPHQVTIQASDRFGGKTTLTVNLTVTNEVENTPFTLWGTPGADGLTGENGNDTIYGSGANDVLSGLGGDDRIHGGAGKDQLTGGAGKDVFVFDTRLNKRTNVDKISDFRYQDDSIYLENRYLTKLGSGTASKPKKFKSDMFVQNTKAQDAEDRIVYDKRTGKLYYDEDGTGAKAQILIATLTNKATLKYHDFFVI
jgi:serralysin